MQARTTPPLGRGITRAWPLGRCPLRLSVGDGVEPCKQAPTVKARRPDVVGLTAPTVLVSTRRGRRWGQRDSNRNRTLFTSTQHPSVRAARRAPTRGRSSTSSRSQLRGELLDQGSPARIAAFAAKSCSHFAGSAAKTAWQHHSEPYASGTGQTCPAAERPALGTRGDRGQAQGGGSLI
jgi:hypothetical protein